MATKALTPKQKRFCEEYVIDFNATKAAERVGYSQKTANEQGACLKNVEKERNRRQKYIAVD